MTFSVKIATVLMAVTAIAVVGVMSMPALAGEGGACPLKSAKAEGASCASKAMASAKAEGFACPKEKSAAAREAKHEARAAADKADGCCATKNAVQQGSDVAVQTAVLKAEGAAEGSACATKAAAEGAACATKAVAAEGAACATKAVAEGAACSKAVAAAAGCDKGECPTKATNAVAEGQGCPVAAKVAATQGCTTENEACMIAAARAVAGAGDMVAMAD